MPGSARVYVDELILGLFSAELNLKLRCLCTNYVLVEVFAQSATMGSFFRLLVVAVVLLQGSALLDAARNVDIPVRSTVIIIGAGMSGINAGKRLVEKGVTDIIILEAREQIGRRMYSHDFNGITIEKGANWIEGTGGGLQNPILPIAEAIGLIYDVSNFDNTTNNVFDQNGFVAPEVAEATAKKVEEMYEFTEQLGIQMNNSTESDVCVLTAQRFYNQYSSGNGVGLYYHNDFEFAEPPRVTSLKSTQPLKTFSDFGGDLNFVHDPRGYKAVVHHLAHSYLANKDGKITDPRLKLNKVVNKVEYRKRGVRVTCEDGSVYVAGYAIVSVSLGVLQSNLIDFEPDLPFWKLKSIYTFNMAVYTKIFLKFPRTFWNTHPGAKFFVYADERRGYYPIWENLDSEFPGQNLLMVTVTDEEARRVEQQPDSETLDEIMGVLRSMYGPDVPRAEAIFVPRWFTDRLFRGSFSNWPLGVDSSTFDHLQAPVKSLYFTGEHTSEKYNGYVHGAYLQGIVTANELLDCMFKRKCSKPNSAYESVVANAHTETELLRQMKKNTRTPGAAR
ncbi:hypothetical protein M758_12G031200 [Ceratodon purpureus]|nr:hypothetical protein M758_12G031200 [Ceratodon purpureus]